MSKINVEKIASLSGHRDCVYALEEGETENILFSGSSDGMVVQWDLLEPENGKLIAQVENSIYALHYMANKKQLLIGHNFKGIHLLDLVSGKELHSAAITDAAIFDIKSSGEFIFVAAGDGTLIILSAADLSTIDRIKCSDKSARSIAINEKKGYVAVGYSDYYIRIFSLSNFSLLKEFQAHQNSIFTVTFSPDGLYLLSGSRDASLKIWSVEKDFVLKESIVAHMYAINHISYSPDGRYFATCSMDKSIKIWDSLTYQLLKVIDKSRYAGHGTSVNKLRWSSFNNYIISCSDDRSISLWDISFIA